MPERPPFVEVFLACDAAVELGLLIRRAEERGIRLQNWFEDRLAGTGLAFVRTGTNEFPDFVLRDFAEGYEVKGLAVPGRWKSYDANSRVPRGVHRDREIYYVFGRYPDPKKVSDGELKVVDLVVCHGSFINPGPAVPSPNRSIRGFGGYADILVRNRRMYVPPTPYALALGAEQGRTLIAPEGVELGPGLEEVGRLVRREGDLQLVGYEVEMESGDLEPRWQTHPNAGREHPFIAYRAAGAPGPEVRLATPEELQRALDEAEGRAAPA